MLLIFRTLSSWFTSKALPAFTKTLTSWLSRLQEAFRTVPNISIPSSNTNVHRKISHSNTSTSRSHTKDSPNHPLIRQHTAFLRKRSQDVVRATKALDGLFPRPDLEQARVWPVQEGHAHGLVLTISRNGDPRRRRHRRRGAHGR